MPTTPISLIKTLSASPEQSKLIKYNSNNYFMW
uniref:Uncharacterized protein n=1 Tax=Setaria italica TaxID=4555 RepID=K3ZGT0_SETIT